MTPEILYAISAFIMGLSLGSLGFAWGVNHGQRKVLKMLNLVK